MDDKSIKRMEKIWREKACGTGRGPEAQESKKGK
jgi:hypothetical protein